MSHEAILSRCPEDRRLRQVRGLILDCDGVLTPGELYYDVDGGRMLRFNTRDGFGIAALCRSGTPVGVLSGRPTDIAERRLRELGVGHFEGRSRDKAAGVRRMCEQMGMDAQACAYMGDDVPDLGGFAAAGLSIAVADSAAELLERADWITSARGGHGAVREVCESLLKAHGHWKRVIERMMGTA